MIVKLILHGYYLKNIVTNFYDTLSGPRPLDIFVRAIPYRLAFGFVAAGLVWITPILVPDASAGLPIFYSVLLVVCYAAHQVIK